MSTARQESGPDRQLLSAERLRAFTDAVVAIAMTLLILPLVESVPEAAHADLTASEWAGEHVGQVISFVLSFALIADGWLDHHRLFDRVHSTTSRLAWLSVAWMVTIVWLPVPTAMLNTIESDALQKVLYIGTLLLMRAMMLASRIYLTRHPELHDVDPEQLRSATVANAVMLVLLVVILLVAVLTPSAYGYFALAGLALTGVIRRAVQRRFLSTS